MWTLKMLKLVYIHNSHRAVVLQSLLSGYEFILRRRLASSCLLSASGEGSVFSTLPFPSSVPITTRPVPNYRLDLDNWDGNGRHYNKMKKRKSQLPKIGAEAERALGLEKFSMNSSLSFVFGDYNDVITLLTLKNSRTDHPLRYLAALVEAESSFRNEGGPNPFPLWKSMMAFLVSEAFGYSKEKSIEERKIMEDRHHRMGKILEITYITQQIHKRILDVTEMQQEIYSVLLSSQKPVQEFHNANKAAALIGDLLWTQKCVHMAALKCQPVTALICGFLMDYCESEFVFGVPSKNFREFTRNKWVHKNQLSIGSLMGNTVSAMLLFSGHGEKTRKTGYRLGSLMGLTYQAYEDLQFFEQNDLRYVDWIDIGMLPVVLKFSKDPELVFASAAHVVGEILGDVEILELSQRTLGALQDETLQYLNRLEGMDGSSLCRDILERFILRLD